MANGSANKNNPIGCAHLIQGHPGSGIVSTVRALHVGLGGKIPFRAPHYTIGHQGMLGELALAAGGILFLDDILEFVPSVLRRLLWHWDHMDAKVQPILVVGLRLSTAKQATHHEWSRIEKLAEILPPIKHHVIAG